MPRYNDLAFNNGPYIEQYQGVPLKEIAETSAELSSRHYANLARLNQIQLLGEQINSKVLPGAKSYVQEQLQGINQELEELSKSGAENSTAVVNTLANKFLGNQGVLRASEQAAEYQKFLQTQREIAKTGKTAVYNKDLEQQYLNSSVVDSQTGKMSSVYNDPFKLRAEAFIEPVEEIDKLWDVIKPDSMESILGSRDYLMLSKLIPQAVENGAVDMPLFYEMVKKSGISPDKIKAFTSAVKRQVDASDLGRQSKEFGTVSPQQMDDLILQRGLMKVYNNTDRSVVQSGVTDDLLRGTKKQPDFGLRTPLPAKVREKFDPGFNTSDISEFGGVKPSLIENIISAFSNPSMLHENAKQHNLEADLLEKSGHTKQAQAMRDMSTQFEKEAKEMERTDASHAKERTENMLGYMRTAIEVTGQGTDNMSDQQVKAIAATPNGQKLLKDYLDNYAGQRFHSPYINNIVDEKTRQANEDFLRGNFSQREFIDMATGEHYDGLRDKSNEVRENLLDLSLALQQKKAIVEGTVDPKHIYTQLAADGDNFVRGLRVQVPVGDKGEMKEFLVSQPLESTSAQDINENHLYNAATEAPGSWGDIGNNMKVLTPASDQQKEVLWSKYGYKSGLMKEQFLGNDIVILNIDGGEKIFPNYTIAAKWLAENKGVKLSKQAKK